jgi:phosphatidylinositol glycan class B
MPSHIILFGSLLDATEDDIHDGMTIREALQNAEYEEVWRGWNGFDWAQDEVLRRGGVKIWRQNALSSE